MLGKVLQSPEFDAEDDLRSGILPDIHYHMLAFTVNNGYSWREVTLLWEVFQDLLNKFQGELLPGLDADQHKYKCLEKAIKKIHIPM